MIRQGLFNDDILEKKYKILRTSIMLGNTLNRSELMSSYEETAKEIDKVKRGIYEEKVASKMYTTTSFEEEEKRLSELIELIENRIKERNDFIDDYIKITANYLDDLPKVEEENNLVDYKIRLDNIREFTDNCNQIKELNNNLKSLRDELEEKYENKANSEIINSKLEDELIEEFNRYISRDSFYASLNYMDIDDELGKIESVLNDKYDVMNTFISSYDALKNAGITGAEREEYLSYVKDSKRDYYTELEKKYVLDIYKLVLDKENDYSKLYDKRINIQNLLNDRDQKREELEINTRDELSYFKDLCNEQFSIIKSQKFNIDNIDKLIVAISECENRLDELEEANKRKEIVDLLEEYSEKAPESVKIDLPTEEEAIESISEPPLTPKAPNMVIKVSEPIKINVKNAADTAKLVMKKVVIVLEPKKFNNKRDKIKEAEAKLAEEKAKEEEKLTIKNDTDFVELDVNNETDSVNDDIFIDFNSSNESKNNLADSENYLKVDFVDNNPVPTEISIFEPEKEKPVQLFSETDPFLDDNQFEVSDVNKTKAFVNGMPMVDNIGTVKPTSVLSQIENVTKDNSNIILPTMGLTNSDKTDIPLVSENYIKDNNL